MFGLEKYKEKREEERRRLETNKGRKDIFHIQVDNENEIGIDHSFHSFSLPLLLFHSSPLLLFFSKQTWRILK